MIWRIEGPLKLAPSWDECIQEFRSKENAIHDVSEADLRLSIAAGGGSFADSKNSWHWATWDLKEAKDELVRRAKLQIQGAKS